MDSGVTSTPGSKSSFRENGGGGWQRRGGEASWEESRSEEEWSWVHSVFTMKERLFKLWCFGGCPWWMVSHGVTWEGTEWNSYKITFYLDSSPQIKNRSSWDSFPGWGPWRNRDCTSSWLPSNPAWFKMKSLYSIYSKGQSQMEIFSIIKFQPSQKKSKPRGES